MFYIKNDRIGYARFLGVKIGRGGQILDDPDDIFGTEPWLVKIGNNVDITHGVEFLTHEGGMWCARLNDKSLKNMDLFSPISVGNNVMIGIDSLIMPGVHIGNNVIIGGHSVVTKDIPDGTIYAGSPAKQISTMDKFMDNLNQKEMVPTKGMTQDNKKKYLMELYPEWFENE